jgi:WLM domain
LSPAALRDLASQPRLPLWGLDLPPSPAAQSALLDRLRLSLQPVITAEGLPTTFVLEPGTRLRRAYGRCTWSSSEPARITVRCTADGAEGRWRRQGAIVGTLLHELAHLKYRHHGPRFWALHRRLVDRAARSGVFDPRDQDLSERGRGDEKLAGSAAHAVALAAREARRARTRENRAALEGWQVGSLARVMPGRFKLSGKTVRVLALGRSRLLVESVPDRRQYTLSPGLLERVP